MGKGRFHPLSDHILVRRVEEDTKTAGGIIIPDTAQEKPSKGEVIAVGPGAKDSKGDVVPLEVSIGQTVMFKKWGGTEVKMDDEEYVIVREQDVLGILETSS